MKPNIKCSCFILLILMNLGLIIVSPVVKAEEYQLGFDNKTRLTLVYEYTKVESDLLGYLADTTGADEYEDLAKIDEGDQFKMVISDIDETEDFWLITVELYSGENLDERGDDLETKVYKKPSKLVNKIFEDDTEDTSSLYFMPLDTEKYLESLEELAIEDIEYSEVSYSIFVDGTELTFDYTGSGYSDTLIQEYGEDGILESFVIKSNGEEVFKRELIDSYEDFSVAIYSIFTIIVSIISILSVSAFIIQKRKKNEPLDSKLKVDKILKDIK